VGRVGMTEPSRSLDEGKEHESGAFHGLKNTGNLGALVMADPHHRGPNGHKPWLAPPVTSLAASKSFSRSVDVTKAHDMTLVGGVSFNGASLR
jgi:hypothetical protein